MIEATTPEAPRSPIPPHAWYALAILVLVNMANYVDRLVISVLMPAIKADLQLSDTQLGLLTGFAFAIFYAVAGLPIARLADTSSRKAVISAALAAWSVMTAACGLAQSYLQLIAARIGVAVGEAGCLPTAQSLLSDHFPAARRSSAMAIFTAGSTLGVSVGLMAGGLLEASIGWRGAFIALGLPGVLLSILAYTTLREPPRGGQDRAAPEGPRLANLRALLRERRSYIHLAMVVATGNFVSFGLAQWMPSFYARAYGASMQEVGVWYGLISGGGLIVGTLAGGYLGDRILRRGARAVLAFAAVTLTLAFVAKTALFFSPTFAGALALNFASSSINMLSHGPTFALVAGAAPAHLRAQATALLMLLSALIGTGAGPVFVGVVSDAFNAAGHGSDSLRLALMACAAFSLWPLAHLWAAAARVESDTGFAAPGSPRNGEAPLRT